MRRLLSAVAAIGLMLPAASHAQGFRHPRADTGAQQNGQPEQQRGNARARGRTEGRSNSATAGQAQADRGEAARQNFAAEQRQQRSAERDRSSAAQQNLAQQQRFAQERQRQDLDRRGEQRFAQERQRQNFDRGRDFDRRSDRDREQFRGRRDFGGRRFAYEGQFRGPVHMGAFRYPRGYRYRHWARGEFLPSIFLSAPFFIDYGLLGLPPPPPDYRWVRYGPDALLVDVYSGEVVDVIYNAFY